MKTARNAIVASFASLAFFIAPTFCQAAQGFTADQTLLRADPGPQPLSRSPPVGSPVTVFGCLRGRVWCDISFQGDRGWVSRQDLEIFFHGRRVRIVEVTPVFVPVVTFEVSTYWDRYYRSKPLFAQRDRFSVNINSNNGGKAAYGRTRLLVPAEALASFAEQLLGEPRTPSNLVASCALHHYRQIQTSRATNRLMTPWQGLRNGLDHYALP